MKERQDEYYKVLGEGNQSSNLSEFMEFFLNVIYDGLCEITDTQQATQQVERLLEVIVDKEYSTKELMELLGLKHRPTFRKNYLLPALEQGLIEMTVPDKPNSSKQKYRESRK